LITSSSIRHKTDRNRDRQGGQSQLRCGHREANTRQRSHCKRPSPSHLSAAVQHYIIVVVRMADISIIKHLWTCYAPIESHSWDSSLHGYSHRLYIKYKIINIEREEIGLLQLSMCIGLTVQHVN